MLSENPSLGVSEAILAQILFLQSFDSPFVRML
jgi:hypothetical protein